MAANLKNISDEGLRNVIMNINDIIQRNMDVTKGSGLQVGNEWITPEGCYWLYRLLEPARGTCLVSDTVLNALRNGTNAPETLKDW